MSEKSIDDKPNYFSKRYIHINRWSSYSKIIEYVLKYFPKNILEIGIGNGFLLKILREMGFNVKGLDIDKSLNPDYLMDVRDDKILNLSEKFDFIIASEVFEHIKYEEYLECLKKFSKLSKFVLLSLPYTEQNAKILFMNIRISLLNKLNFYFHFNRKFFLKRTTIIPNKQHYWEIGIKGYSLRRIKKDIIKNGLIIVEDTINPSNFYHYFFVLTSKNYL